MVDIKERLADYGLTLEPDVVICDRRTIDEAVSRIAELETENERLRNMLNGYGKLDAELAIAERRIEALSRTGAVKTLDERDFEDITNAAARSMRKAASGVRGQTITVYDDLGWWIMKETERRIRSALEPAAPEGQQEAGADAVRFLYKHGALTHIAAREAVELLTSNGFEISRRPE